MRTVRAAALMALAFAGAAHAQDLTTRAPVWAQLLVAADIAPTTGGRMTLAGDGVAFAVRVTIAPHEGGVARVIRFEQRANQTTLALRRFTGHPTTGWWLWGPDTPYVTRPSAAQRDEVQGLLHAALGVAALVTGDPTPQQGSCASGERAFVEVVEGARAVSATRNCIDAAEPVGRLARRLSDLAGSRDEDELHDAANAELLAADQAFNAKAQADGVPAAWAEYTGEHAIAFNGSQPVEGHDAVVALFHDWPAGAHLSWTPQHAEVSERGDMGWTWGRSVFVAPDGTRREGRYVTTWSRDYEGHWRFSFDAALREPPAAPAPHTVAPAPAAHH